MAKAKASPSLRIGDLLLQEGYLKPAQLEQALKIQGEQENYSPLGRVCVELGLVSPKELQRLLRKYHKRMYLGELLQNLGLLTQAELEHLLQLQKIEQKRLGDLLIEHQIITESQLTDALSMQLDIPRILPSIELIDPRLLQGLNGEELSQQQYLPVHRNEDQLTVVMADPLNQDLISSLEMRYNCQILPAIAPASEIKATLTAFFKQASGEVAEWVIDNQNPFILDDSQQEQDPTATAVNFIISSAVIDRASDIHIEPQERYLRVRFRIDGLLHHKTDLPFDVAKAMIRHFKELARLQTEEAYLPQSSHIQAQISGKEIDIRVSTFPGQWGEKLVISLLEKHSTLLNLERVGFSPVYLKTTQRVLDIAGGIIVVTGPARSGKSTTLYAAMNYLNDLDKALVTLEKPIVYQLPGVVQTALRPGQSPSGLIDALVDQDPDILMVQDIPDSATALALTRAAVMGYKVLTSLHTRDLASALFHLMHLGVEPFLIASTVTCVISQRLVRHLCDNCKTPCQPEPALLQRFPLKSMDLQLFSFYDPVGCTECQFQGYKGRSALHEIMVMTDSLRDALISGQTLSAIRQLARRENQLISFAEDGFYKASQGVTSLQEVLRVAPVNESDRQTGRSTEEVFALCTSRLPDPLEASSVF
jgi:type IV pilus assembly protein PilB